MLDVRAGFEYELDHLPGAMNIAHTRLLGHLEKIPRQKPVLVHCQVGLRSRPASALLERPGFQVIHLARGYHSWVQAGGEAV